VRFHVAPDVGEPSVRLEAGDNTVMFVGDFADIAGAVEEHCTRILRSAERKMNAARSNG